MTDWNSLKAFGDFGESWVIQFLESLGVKCEHGNPGDLVSGQVRLEIKISRLTQHDRRHKNRFQFCLWRDGHAEFDADFLICLCCPDAQKVTDAYVIPRESVDHKRKLSIFQGDYAGKWLPFRDAWKLILTHPKIEWRECAPKDK